MTTLGLFFKKIGIFIQISGTCWKNVMLFSVVFHHHLRSVGNELKADTNSYHLMSPLSCPVLKHCLSRHSLTASPQCGLRRSCWDTYVPEDDVEAEGSRGMVTQLERGGARLSPSLCDFQKLLSGTTPGDIVCLRAQVKGARSVTEPMQCHVSQVSLFVGGNNSKSLQINFSCYEDDIFKWNHKFSVPSTVTP